MMDDLAPKLSEGNARRGEHLRMLRNKKTMIIRLRAHLSILVSFVLRSPGGDPTKAAKHAVGLIQRAIGRTTLGISFYGKVREGQGGVTVLDGLDLNPVTPRRPLRAVKSAVKVFSSRRKAPQRGKLHPSQKLRAGANGTTAVPHVFDDDCEGNVYECRRALPPRTNADELLRHTIDDILTEAPTDLSCPSTLTPRLDLLHTRQSDTAQDSPSSSHSSFPNLQNLGTSFMHVGRLPSAESHESSKNDGASREGEIDECTVCMSAKVNSALYKCGHSCMCYECAMQTYRSSGLCPLCRASILDVIKIFKA
uniref:RING-type domain-containing protein n=1 Tax=Haemonchus placei TaxID=6290 RepID=A0A158QN83_HAEPC